MAQAVEGSVAPVRAFFQIQFFQYPAEQPANGAQCKLPVGFLWEKHIVFGTAKAIGFVPCLEPGVNAHCLRHAHHGGTVPLDFWRCDAQIVVFAFDDFDVFVFQLPNITWAHEGVNHETNQPVHFVGHAAIVQAHVEPFFKAFPLAFFVAQLLGGLENAGVFGDGESAPGYGIHFQLGK